MTHHKIIKVHWCSLLRFCSAHFHQYSLASSCLLPPSDSRLCCHCTALCEHWEKLAQFDYVTRIWWLSSLKVRFTAPSHPSIFWKCWESHYYDRGLSFGLEMLWLLAYVSMSPPTQHLCMVTASRHHHPHPHPAPAPGHRQPLWDITGYTFNRVTVTVLHHHHCLFISIFDVMFHLLTSQSPSLLVSSMWLQQRPPTDWKDL